MKSFWQTLPKPFTVLAPMEGVTDVVFREIITSVGKPDVFFTEFTSVGGIMSKGREKVSKSFKFTKKQKPIVAQIWGTNPDFYSGTAEYCKSLGFDGIDINMGCPIDTVVKKGACSALINNHFLAKEIIESVKKAGLPVSVKTRIGFNSIEIDNWIGFLLSQNLEALTIHFRTAEEMSKAPAHWELMPKIIALRDKISPKTLIIGNGDLESMDEIKEKYKEYKCDGFMVGRGVLSNPWFFNKSINFNKITPINRLDLYIKHIGLFLKTWKDDKNPESLKRFSKTYVNNFPDATHLRDRINISKTTDEIIEVINNYKNNLKP